MSNATLPRPVSGTAGDPRPVFPDILLPNQPAEEKVATPEPGSREGIRLWAKQLLAEVSRSLATDKTEEINQILREIGAPESNTINSSRPIMERMSAQLETLLATNDDAPLENLTAQQKEIVALTQQLEASLRESKQEVSQAYRTNEERAPIVEEGERLKAQVALDKARVYLSELAQLMHMQHGIDGDSAVAKKMVEMRGALEEIETELGN